ncbi:MAG: YfhO family protein [Oliverpabstia sp.]
MRKIVKDPWTWFWLGVCPILCWLFVGQYGIFGSEVDWISQHSVLPEGFRQHFYQTGELFPQMYWNLGGGQNIYNFAYYGLWNPVILISYMLPFVDMDVYLMVVSVLSYSISVVLFYHWMCEKNSNKKDITVYLLTAMFALAAPMIYHSYNQVMFVNYMPFLLLGLSGTDRYFCKNRRVMLIVSIAGMILTSFYFSIGGMLVLWIYAVGEYVWKDSDYVSESYIGKNGTGKKFAGYACMFLVALVCVSFYLYPVAKCVLAGREGTGSSGISAIIHKIQSSWFTWKPERLLYSAHGIGLSSLALTALLGRVFSAPRWKEKWNSFCILLILTVPAFGYLLNGGLYDKSKVFIPFLPLVCLEIKRFCVQKSQGWKNGLPFLITIAAVCVGEGHGLFIKHRMWILAESIAIFLLFVVKNKIAEVWKRDILKEMNLLLSVSCVILFFYGWSMNVQMDYMIFWEEYREMKKTETKTEEMVQKVLEQDTDWYRVDVAGNGKQNLQNINRLFNSRQYTTSIYSSLYNQDYHRFRNQTFLLNQPLRNTMMQSVTDNPCFLTFMGVKYVIAGNAPDGYQVWCDQDESNRITDDFHVYKNKNVAPMMYVTNCVINEDDYYQLDFPECQTVLLQNAVIQNEMKQNEEKKYQKKTTAQKMKECHIDIPEINNKDLSIEKKGDTYEIRLEKEMEIEAVLTGRAERDALIAMKFEVENLYPNRDMYIRLEEQTNRLSAENYEYANHNRKFCYMVTVEGNTVHIKLGKGRYNISGIRVWTGSMDKLQNKELYQTPVTVRQEDVKGDTITGTVYAEQEGYLVTGIPYDQGLKIWIDGIETEILRINTAFLGTKITGGYHKIKISPGRM